MKRIEKKSLNPFVLLKRKISEFKREMCFRFKNFLNEHTRDMCFNRDELEQINERVEKTKTSEKKFDYFEENLAPKIAEFIENIQGENIQLRAEKEFCMNGIKELYIADKNGDVELKKMLFGKFGLPYVLNEN
jgi:hypothetical protein